VTVWGFLLAALKAAPELLRLINSLRAAADAAEQRGIGRDQAVKESLENGARLVTEANEARAEAERRHANDPSDAAFDPEFMRKE